MRWRSRLYACRPCTRSYQDMTMLSKSRYTATRGSCGSAMPPVCLVAGRTREPRGAVRGCRGGRVDRSAPRAGGRRGAGEGARMAERGRTLTERDRRESARASGRRTRPEAEPRYIAWHISAPLDHHQPKDLAHIFEEDLFRAFTECDSTE